MLGLNDPHIARRNPVPMRAPWQVVPGHGKGDGDYVIARQPDYIILGPASGIPVDAEPWFLTDVELAENAAFALCYDEQKVNLDLQDAAKHKGRPTNWPILFTYYTRTCD
jgi:arabinofuranosyltransferase